AEAVDGYLLHPVAPTELVQMVRALLRLGKAQEDWRFLAEASRVLGDSLNWQATLDRLACLAVPHLADWCVIDLIGEDRRVRPAAVAHVDPSRVDQVREMRQRFPPGLEEREVVSRVWQTGRPVVFPALAGKDVETTREPEHPRLLVELGFKSYVCVPLSARGRTLGAITLVRSSSGRRYQAPDLVLAEDFVRRAALAIDNARHYDEAQEAVRCRDEFLAMLAHELRNPLAPILNAVQIMAERGLQDPSLRRARDVVERQGRHMARLLDDLLDISRITRGRIELRKTPLDLQTVLAQAVQTSRLLLQERRHQLLVDLPRGPLPVEADSTRLEQIFANLLNNAARYTEPGGRIHLTAERAGAEVVTRVRDNGMGIPPEMLTRIFEPFQQLDHSLARSQGGLGIGLTLVRRLVEMHGGVVEALSEGPGQGSEFVVRLPLSTANANVREEKTGEGSASSSCRVLLIEDNDDSREMLKELLELWGHQVEIATDGLEGLARILAAPPDLVLVDIGLPGLDGYQVARRVRAAPHGKNIFLAALTGYGQKEDRRRTKEAGFNTHLTKPVDLDELSRLLADRVSAGRNG
ncbi:MAG: response regulator, partial [Planctomycetes bacterium]|nr:response regulator [Planctomycetota bacterium]